MAEVDTSVLPRLQDRKVMGVADEDAPEDPKRQETIVGRCAGESFRGVCVCEEGHLGEFKCADLQVLRRYGRNWTLCSIEAATKQRGPC